jgi:hypothetical protein
MKLMPPHFKTRTMWSCHRERRSKRGNRLHLPVDLLHLHSNGLQVLVKLRLTHVVATMQI